MIVIDGTNMIFGRLASQLAKKMLEGEEVHLVNAEKLVIRGDPAMVSEKYLALRRVRNKATPEKSPHWPRVPHLLVKRMIRGMLPHKRQRGINALHRLRVYTGNPKNLQSNLSFDNAAFDGSTRHTTVLELCRRIGYTG